MLVLAVGFGFILYFLFAQMWVSIQHASPLAHKRMNGFWLGFTLAV